MVSDSLGQFRSHLLASLLFFLDGIGHEPNKGDTTVVISMARRPIVQNRIFVAALACEIAGMENGKNLVFSGNCILNCPKLSELPEPWGVQKNYISP